MDTLSKATAEKIPDFVPVSAVSNYPEIPHSEPAFRQLRHRSDEHGLSALFVKRAGRVLLFTPGYFHWLRTGEVVGPAAWASRIQGKRGAA